ncbi:MAG: 4Fe-4S dicluster domain-containing protein, partial [Atribacterota bacterium]
KCHHCRHCLAICPQQALRFDQSGNLQVNGERCHRCGKCAVNCPSGSISLSGNTWTVSEVTEVVKRDIPFYRRSGGGVTLSGGEPLHQAPFVGELLQTCKNLYLHTAIQTTGYAKWDSLTAILPFVDLFIFDLKTVDPILWFERGGAGDPWCHQSNSGLL